MFFEVLLQLGVAPVAQEKEAIVIEAVSFGLETIGLCCSSNEKCIETKSCCGILSFKNKNRKK